MNFNVDYMLDLSVELLKLPSPVGYTDKAMKRIAEELDKLGYSYSYTRKGCIMFHIEGENTNYTKLVSAHVDTLGGVVKTIKSNGRLELMNLGGFSWGAVEGENVTVYTLDDKKYSGSLLPNKASVHIFGDEARDMPRVADNMEVRLDEDVYTEEDTRKLGICQGDIVSFETRTVLTETGYLKSRYLDDKVCVAQLITYLKYLKDENKKPNTNIYIYFSNYEEIGHGVSVIPDEVDEFVAIDIGLVGGDAYGDEKKVGIAARDFKTIYDRNIRKNIQDLADKNNIKYTVGFYNRYGSDATAALSQGFDLRVSCIGPNVDATHHYERTHVDGLIETVKLFIAYL